MIKDFQGQYFGEIRGTLKLTCFILADHSVTWPFENRKIIKISGAKSNALLDMESTAARIIKNKINAMGIFVLSMLSTQESKVQITDMLGRNIELPFVLEKESYTFNTTSLKAGVYLVKITQDEKTCTKKLVIE